MCISQFLTLTLTLTLTLILDRHYKIGPITDHPAKFHAGRPMHLGDLASGEKNKTSELKHKSASASYRFRVD